MYSKIYPTKLDLVSHIPKWVGNKPEPIILLILPIFLPEFPTIFTHYSLFIPMLASYHLASYYSLLFLKFDCVTCKIADK